MEKLKKEEIYLDLSKLSEDEQKESICILPIDNISSQIYFMIKYEDWNVINKFNYLFFNDKKVWQICVSKREHKAEISLSQFKELFQTSAEDAQVENNGWISVNEKPKSFQEVILYREDAGVFVGYYGNLAESLSEMAVEYHYENRVSEETMWKDQFFYFGIEGNGILEGSEEPTHWMPLPEPPKF